MQKMPKILLLPFLLLSLVSCNSPEARLERLQRAFREKFAQQDFFEVTLEKEVLHLPLPPVSAPSDQQKQWVSELQQQAAAIDGAQLNDTQQKQLAQLRTVLDDLAAHTHNPLFDPLRYSLHESLEKTCSSGDVAKTNFLLGNIPAYYAAVEQRWQTPDLRLVPDAVEKSKKTVDLLKKMEEEWKGLIPRNKTEPAKAAIKDFIGLCQSAVLQ